MTGLPRPLAASRELSSIPLLVSKSRQKCNGSEISSDRQWTLRRKEKLPELPIPGVMPGISSEGKDPSNNSYSKNQRMEVDENFDSENNKRELGEDSTYIAADNFGSPINGNTQILQQSSREHSLCGSVGEEETEFSSIHDHQSTYANLQKNAEDWEMEEIFAAPNISKADKQSKKLNPTTKQRRTTTLFDLNFVQVLSKAPGDVASPQLSNMLENTNHEKTRLLTEKTAREPIDSRNIFCPVPGCGNQGGIGYRRGGLNKHLMGQHSVDLEKTGQNYALISRLLTSLEKRICPTCKIITKGYTAEGFCSKCDKKRPAASKIKMDLSTSQRDTSTAELLSIQSTRFTLRRAEETANGMV